ncbi:MAG: hypothetical protein ACFE9L_05780 [Candidatus Hodarchaeota archaeon]
MSKVLDKDEIRVQTIEEFQKVDTVHLKERHSRYLWAVQGWKRIIGRRITLPPHIDVLYGDGSCAFYYGYFSASILTITATIELTLKAIVDLSLMPSKTKKTLVNVIKEAVNQEIISNELATDLHFLRKNTRNILSHRPDMASHMTVGWEKDPTSTTRHMLSDERLEKLAILQRESGESLFVSREVFAREALQLLFRVFKSCIDSGRKWTDLVKK